MTPSSWSRLRSRFALSAGILALLAKEDQFQVFRRDGFITGGWYRWLRVASHHLKAFYPRTSVG